MSVYKVTGRLPYRDHKPGVTFEAMLEPDEEIRALERGNVIIVKVSRPGLVDGSWTLPDGWVARG